jgi:hypothetical protein
MYGGGVLEGHFFLDPPSPYKFKKKLICIILSNIVTKASPI